MSDQEQWGRDTLAIRAAELRGETLEHSPSIFATSSFVFRSAEHAAAVFAGEQVGNIYSRFTNPTVQAFERRLAALEGADTRTAITHPATTTHGRMGALARARAGIGDGLVRIALGLENIEDIIADIEPGLRAG